MGLVVHGLVKRGNVWWARIVVPADVRPVLGKTELLESLDTGADADAVRLGTPVIAEFKRQIAAARGQFPAPARPDDRLTAGLVQSRLDAWERKAVRNAETAHINDVIAPLSWSEKSERSEFLYALGQPDAWAKVQGFKDQIAEAPVIPTSHPALDQKQFQFWSRDAWRRVERTKDRFAAGDFSEVEEGDVEAETGGRIGAVASGVPDKATGASKNSTTFDGLLDAFLSELNPPTSDNAQSPLRPVD